jgi:hypothetical protein
VGKPEERGPLGRPRCRWEVMLKWIFEKWDWINLAQDRDRWQSVVNAGMNLLVLQDARNFSTS